MEEARPRKQIIEKSSQAPVSFLESFPAKLDLFSQVHLIKLSSTFESYKQYQVPKNHLCYAFKLDGELKGSVIGMLNFQNSKLPDQVLSNLKNVFTESLNVLLGKFLTNLEESNNIMATLSAPKDLNNYKIFPE
ncbi:hypothetical protein N9N67_05490, partial [Bacteriovoracaceae bacterium]|nr:hypothetical protein [Bacteriovoracaceae bacterium]